MVGIRLGGIKERQNVQIEEIGEAAERSNRSAHLAALEGAQESNRDTDGAGDLGQRESALQAQAPEPGTNLAGRRAARAAKQSLGLQQVDDRWGVHPAGAAQELSALQQAHVLIGEEAIMAVRAGGSDETEGLPSAQYRGRNSHQPSDVSDPQIALRVHGPGGKMTRGGQSSFPLTSPRPYTKVRGL